ncbi:MAG: serine hydrolase domain-containing protein [Pseudomonadota bacterium]
MFARRLLSIVIAIGLVVLLSSCVTPGHRERIAAAERVDQFLRNGVDHGFSGAVLVAVDGQIVLNQGYGWAVKDDATPFTPDTVFSIGSVTKQFTATAILLLSEQSSLSLEDPITRFFTDVPVDKRDITLHQLLTHSSGLPHDIGSDFEQTSTEAYFATLLQQPLLFEPGVKHNYSNAGYSILARVVELTSGQDYEAFLAKHLFGPAGMTQTGYFLPTWHDANLSHGYTRNIFDRGSMIHRFREDGLVSWHLKGNGGIHSTQNDMYRWYMALVTNTILSPALTRQLTTPYIVEAAGGDSYYAYGWAIFSSDRDTRIVSHNGGNGAYFHDFLWLPEDDAVIIFSTNAASRQVELAWTIEKMLFDPVFVPKPVKKNVYQFVLDFTSEQSISEAPTLASMLRADYRREIADPDTLNRLGYRLLESGSEQNNRWALNLFALNMTLFPEMPNVWDSLGDGYLAIGETELAIGAYDAAVRLGMSDSKEKIDALKH